MLKSARHLIRLPQSRALLPFVQLPAWSWIHGFMLIQFVLQIMLLIPGLDRFRIVMRAGAFALSLALLFGLRQTGLKHPAKSWALVILCIMALQLFWHPYINTVPAGVAQCAMYLAILAPLFWCSRLALDTNSFRGLIFIMWGFHTLSAGVGVLQTYYPDVFHFAISNIIEDGIFGGEHLMITLANGQRIFRPTGLSDLPGGAASSGFYALLFGMGIALQERNFLLRLLGTVSVPIGLFCIYLSQVRSTLVLSGICLIVLAMVLLLQRRLAQLTVLIGAASTIATATLSWAFRVGGEETLDRLSTLTADQADKVVYQNRGFFLEYTLTDLLPEFPLGAGLGRWGMMNQYFGDYTNPMTRPIWVEIQWTGWLIDGGIPLVLAYGGILIVSCWVAWQIMMNPNLRSLQIWAGVVFAYNVGAIAITFNSPLFMSQAGMEFWLINTTLFVAAQAAQKDSWLGT